ncbi:Coatomer epsilon subunit [Macrophomina phaseolina MS6]|uniref:Coatomer epsilon subunit n=1 Tax=Macrophomina phaseolina (strain MS6) TaxID=1126212 RepID=K2REI9_MACPH|nr:Coatomer epsilon subunit [Macrophomina phaseolina MS6]
MAAHANLSPTRALPLLDQALVPFNYGASLSQSGCFLCCTILAAHTLAPPPHDQRTTLLLQALHKYHNRPQRSKRKKKKTRSQQKKDWIQQRVPSPAFLIMQNRSRERGAHTRYFPAGPFPSTLFFPLMESHRTHYRIFICGPSGYCHGLICLDRRRKSTKFWPVW